MAFPLGYLQDGGGVCPIGEHGDITGGQLLQCSSGLLLAGRRVEADGSHGREDVLRIVRARIIHRIFRALVVARHQGDDGPGRPARRGWVIPGLAGQHFNPQLSDCSQAEGLFEQRPGFQRVDVHLRLLLGHGGDND